MTEKREMYEVVDGKVFVTTSTGWRVECLPYGDDLMRAGLALVMPDKPDPPTYAVGEPDEDGSAIRVAYSEASIAGDDVPEEDKQAWAEYQEALVAYQQEVGLIQARVNLAKSRVLVHRATKVHDLPNLRAWAEEREELYLIPQPETDRDLLFQFFTTEVGKTPEDGMRLMGGVMKATGVQEEVLDQFEATFRHTMGRPEGEDAQEDTAGAAAGQQDEAAGLVDEPALDAA